MHITTRWIRWIRRLGRWHDGGPFQANSFSFMRKPHLSFMENKALPAMPPKPTFLEVFSVNNQLLPSQWPFDHPNGGHLTPEKVT